MVPEDFKKDRAAMSGGSFSSEALKAAVPLMRDQYRAHTQVPVAISSKTAAPFWGGQQAGLADIHAYMNPWFINSALPHTREGTSGRISAGRLPGTSASMPSVTARTRP